MNHFNPAQDPRKTIITSERKWHEEKAHRRFSLDEFLYAPPAFEQVVHSSFVFLQMSPGEMVLDMGCGEGKETLQLAQQGLFVVSTDLSLLQLCRARQRVQKSALGAQACFVQADAERLPFASGSFRIIYGKAILHHLEIYLSAQEIKRLLRRGGRATFAEPLAHHPLFWLARQVTPQLRTKDEHPLSFSELRRFGAYFSHLEVEGHFFLSPLSYLFRMLPGGESLFRRIHAFLQRLDKRLFGIFSFLKELAWYGSIKVVR